MTLFQRFLFFTVIWLLPLSLRGTILVPLSVENLAQRAELILHGTVASKICLKDPEGRIYTRMEFKVRGIWKGNLSTNFFTIVQAGGTVGEERTVVDGEATYEVGEELVSFLRLNHRSEGVSIGMAQGKFSVWRDGATGEPFAHNLFHGRPEGDETPAQAALRAAAGRSGRLGFQELRQRANRGAR